MVLGRVERDAELVEIAANGGAQFGGVFADAGGKHQRVRAVELREAGADPMTGLVNKNVEGELGPVVTLRGPGLDVANVVEAAREAFQA